MPKRVKACEGGAWNPSCALTQFGTIEYLGTFLYECICAYLRVYACICVHMRVYAYICVYIHMRVYARICVYMRIYAYICVICVYVCICVVYAAKGQEAGKGRK